MASTLPQTAPGVPAPNVDPTTQELSSIGSVEDILAWLGAADTLGQAINTAMGGSPKLRDIVCIAPTDWEQACDGMEIPVSGTAARKLLPLEKGHLTMVRRIARLRLGLTALPVEATVGAPTTGASPSVPETGSTAPAPTADPSLKLSAVWHPTLDSVLVRMSSVRFRKLFSRYKEKRGADPVEEIEPTLEQVSAAVQVISADRAPYADFGVFGPYGRRLLQKFLCTAWNFNPDGTWSRQQFPGAPTFPYWRASYEK